MKTFISVVCACFLLLLGGCRGISNESSETADLEAERLFLEKLESHRQWPSFRGYFARGYLDEADLPDSWDLPSMENIRWKIPIPGLGLSCPVVWEETLFLTTAISETESGGIRTGVYGDSESLEDESPHSWVVYAIHKVSGEILWQRTACTGIPEVKRHPKSSHANPTVATDGNYVVVFFGSEGVYCYDFEGNLIWSRDFGILMSTAHGASKLEWEFASSPVIYRDRVILQADVEENSFLAALDLSTGEILWKKRRNDWQGWCTPNIYYHQGHARIVVNGFKHRGGYDFWSGEEVWKMSGGGDVPVPTPVQYEDMLYFNSAHGRFSPILVIKKEARGNLRFPSEGRQDEAVAWFKTRGGSYMQTLLIYRDLLYNLKWNGNLECLDASTGETYYRETIAPESFIASPVASDGKIYTVSEEGVVYVVEAGSSFKLLGAFDLGGVSLATPAITEGMILFRTTKHLIGIGKQD